MESDRIDLGTPWGSGSRREFLKLAAAAAAALALPTAVSGCVLGAANSRKLDFHDDFGVLNYAYTLETIEAEFYARVVRNPPADLRPGELDILRDIGAHEEQHRRFFRRALKFLRINIPDRTFAAVDFSTRNSVLIAARTFEDLGVAAYNGAGEHLRLAEFLTIAGKIVSVEARHAAVIRDLLNPKSRDFAGDDVVDAEGMDRAIAPRDVLAQVQQYFTQPLQISGI